MQALKKQQQSDKQRNMQHQLQQHMQHNTADHTAANSDTLTTADDDSLTTSPTTLVHRPSSSTPLTSSHASPMFRPSGGPTVDAILRMRRTNRKVDTDDISSRFQKAMDYKRQRQQQKEEEEAAAKKGKARGR